MDGSLFNLFFIILIFRIISSPEIVRIIANFVTITPLNCPLVFVL